MVGVGALVVVAAALVPVEAPVPVGVHTLHATGCHDSFETRGHLKITREMDGQFSF